MKKLIERVEKYKSLKDEQLQAKSKAKAPAIERKEIRVDHPLLGLGGISILKGLDLGLK